MFLLVVLFLLLIYFSNVNFNTDDDIKQFILNDTDSYVSKMNKTDLEIRNTTKEKYKLKYYKGIITPSFRQRNIINICILKASKFLKFLNSKFISTKHINSLPWKVVLLKKELEHGLPHTRGDFIILPEDITNNSYKRITKTLIHEMVHVYQKKYNKEFKKALLDNGFKIIGKIDRENISANPDIDDIIYLSPNGRTMKHIKNRNISSDVKNEHPNELIAYQIEEMYK